MNHKTFSAPLFYNIKHFEILQMNNHQDINPNTGLPGFNPPATASEARARIAELNSAISSIEDQITVRDLAGTLDSEWLKKCTTSKRFKTLERDRLLNWIEDRQEMLAQGKDINQYIVAVVQNDYEPSEWENVLREAREIMNLGD